MSGWEIPHGLKLEPGSAIKVVTIVADQEKHRGHKKYKDDHKDFKDLKEHKDKDDSKEQKDHKCKDVKDHKDDKEHKDFGDVEGIFTGVVLDETEIDLHCDLGKYRETKEDEKKKDKSPLHVKEEERFLVLSLLKPSPPFSAGQIVWISVEQIVALTIINSK